MTGNQLQEQASDFLHSGEFASNVGDLVIAAISNILKVPIVVFTSVKNMPVIIQHPTHSPTLNISSIQSVWNEPQKVGQKRKREPHQGQSIPLKGKKSLTFMRDVGEPVTTGGFSNMEFLLVSSIIHHLLQEERKNFALKIFRV